MRSQFYRLKRQKCTPISEGKVPWGGPRYQTLTCYLQCRNRQACTLWWHDTWRLRCRWLSPQIRGLSPCWNSTFHWKRLARGLSWRCSSQEGEIPWPWTARTRVSEYPLVCRWYPWLWTGKDRLACRSRIQTTSNTYWPSTQFLSWTSWCSERASSWGTDSE